MKKLAKPTALLTGVALSFALAAPLYAQDTEAAPESSVEEAPAAAPAPASPDIIVATVNGEAITLGHVIAARFSLPDQYQSLPNDVLFDGLIEQLIQQTVLSQAMGEMTRRAQIQLENERRSIIASEKLDALVTAAVDDAKVQAAYDAAYANAEPTEEWNASHILVETEEEAQALIEALTVGADFAELAKEKSTGPSGPSGGELGWFGAGMMVKEFEDAVSGLEVGAVAGPVQTQFGWHVIKLNDTRMKGAPALDEVRDEIVAQLQNDAVEQALATLMDAATIDRADIGAIDPGVLSDPSLLD